MKKLFFYLLPLLAAGWLLPMGSCKKDTGPVIKPPPIIDYSKLPEATQTGANTFGCLVNGEVWVPRVPLLTVTYVDKVTWFSEKNNKGSSSIICNLVDIDKKIDNWLQITFGPTFFNTGDYCKLIIGLQPSFTLKTTNGDYYSSDNQFSTGNCVKVTKIDTTNNIISGNFSSTMFKDTIGNNKIVITDGRFDLHYYPQ